MLDQDDLLQICRSRSRKVLTFHHSLVPQNYLLHCWKLELVMLPWTISLLVIHSDGTHCMLVHSGDINIVSCCLLSIITLLISLSTNTCPDHPADKISLIDLFSNETWYWAFCYHSPQDKGITPDGGEAFDPLDNLYLSSTLPIGSNGGERRSWRDGSGTDHQQRKKSILPMSNGYLGAVQHEPTFISFQRRANR